MATIDIILIAFILISSLFGLIRGLIASALSLIGWILSFYLTFATFPIFEPYLATKISNPMLLKVIGYSMLLVIYLIVFGIINLSLNIATKPFRSNIFNRSLGLVFGFARGILLVIAGLFVYHVNFAALHGMSALSTDITAQTPEFYKKGQIANRIAIYTEKAKIFLPANAEDRIVKFYDNLTNSSLDERFIEYAIIKIERNLDSKIKHRIRDKLSLKEDMLDKSELDLMNLKLAYSEYKRIKINELKAPLNEDEQEKVDSIVLGIKFDNITQEGEND